MIPYVLHKNGRMLAIALVFMFCLGCQQDLYTDFPEQEINEMLAVLLSNDINAKKMPGSENAWSLTVAGGQVARAVGLLKRHGYPKERFQSIGDLFQKKGFITSPLEEKVRYIYALSQEVSETVSKIGGVIAARVHIVMPENDPLSDKNTPSSASIFIKHEPDARVEEQIMKIKQLVVHSVEGLDYKKVSVALFAAKARSPEKIKPAVVQYHNILGLDISVKSVQLFKNMIAIIIGAFVVLAGLFVYGYMRLKARAGGGEDKTNIRHLDGNFETISDAKP